MERLLMVPEGMKSKMRYGLWEGWVINNSQETNMQSLYGAFCVS